MSKLFSTQTSVREPKCRDYNVAMFHERCRGNTHGWLRIWTETIFGKKWRLKYVFLFDGCIYIFNDEHGSKPSVSYCLYSFSRVVRIENGRNRCLEFALRPCLPDILKPKFFCATSEDELQRWMVMFDMEIQNANSTGNPAAVTTRRPSSAHIDEHYNRHPLLSHITTGQHVQVNKQQFGNPQYLGDINYDQGRDVPVNHQQCGNSQYLGDINYEQGRVGPRTLPSCVIGNQYPSHYYNDSRSRQNHFNFTSGRQCRMQNVQDLNERSTTLRYGQAVSVSDLHQVDRRPVTEVHGPTVSQGFNRRAVSMANIPAVPVSSNHLSGFRHQDQVTIPEDNVGYATVQNKINEDQDEAPYLTAVLDDNNKDFDRVEQYTVNSSDDQKQQVSHSSLRPPTCTSECIYDYPDQRGPRTKTLPRNSDTVTMADSVDQFKSSATSSCETDGTNSGGYSYVTAPDKCLKGKDERIGKNLTEVDPSQIICGEKRHDHKTVSIEVNNSGGTSDEPDFHGYTNMYPQNTCNDSDDKNNMCKENLLSETEEDSSYSDKCVAHGDKYVAHSDKWEAPSSSSCDTWTPPKNFL